ncbi:MAG TPA: c-type cytochrome biogenesis protein CcsB [Bacteroidales bacterium]|nr:c-type cytochrome biogenesis protein CcsB [Bacteroidales bacterium]
MKILKFLLSPVFMGSLFIIFAFAMAAATFIENDYGSEAAYGMVYGTRWFELVLFLLAVNLTGQLIINRLFRKNKLPVALFHLAFILMIAGAGITRYFGWEGIMHIREGESTDKCFSDDKYLRYQVRNSSGEILAEESEDYNLSSSSASGFRKKIMAGGREYELVFAGMMSETPVFHLFADGKPEMILLKQGPDESFVSGSFKSDDMEFEIAYGSNATLLPFKLLLNDFILERYPGSDSPSGYRSDVILIDEPENVKMPFEIYMNNVLKYKGYRFYQSSYDPDEKGTVLSVNHDRAGMIVTYTGYAVLFLFIVLSLLIRNSRFRTVQPGLWNSYLRKTVPVVLLMFMVPGLNDISAQHFIPGKNASDELGKILVQDQRGRTKPLFTLSNDIVRKVTGENKFEGYSSMQFFMGLLLDFDHWKDLPLIKVTNNELRRKIGVRGRYAAFSDLVDMSGGGSYKLSADVNSSYSKSPGNRNKKDKEIMKVDERVNILFMIYRGDFLRMFPTKDSTHTWGPPHEALTGAVNREDSLYLQNIVSAMAQAVQADNTVRARQVVSSVSSYQERHTEYQLPSQSRVKAEIIYYKLAVFERLFPFYLSLGLIMIILLIIKVISNNPGGYSLIKVLRWILLAGFILHTSGIALRWYIAGHAPLSNGYESMIFISWITLLAGFIFSRKSDFALSSTAVLSGLTLLVAHMSFMDPEITNLVPVLKSYWLTLHVSVVTGSYGFLGLGALLGLLSLVLLVMVNGKNRERISGTIDELTVINYKTLTLGLYFLTIGTFLGAVWANESWGRYWGWDPKETWSLITIVVYTLVTHSRMIPGMKDIYTFNLLSLFAFSSVLMTYFGVNYYLSGLHSYAGGDPVPVPVFVYVTIILLVTLSVTAYIRYKKFRTGE